MHLVADALRGGGRALDDEFRRRGLLAGIVVGAIAAADLAVLHGDSLRLYAGLTGSALPLVVVSAAAGIASLVLLCCAGSVSSASPRRRRRRCTQR